MNFVNSFWQFGQYQLLGPLSTKLYPSAEPVIKALNSVYKDFGSPQTHRSDNFCPIQLTIIQQFLTIPWNQPQKYSPTNHK